MKYFTAGFSLLPLSCGTDPFNAMVCPLLLPLVHSHPIPPAPQINQPGFHCTLLARSNTACVHRAWCRVHCSLRCRIVWYCSVSGACFRSTAHILCFVFARELSEQLTQREQWIWEMQTAQVWFAVKYDSQQLGWEEGGEENVYLNYLCSPSRFRISSPK